MGVTLDRREIEEFLTNGHTLIVSCLDKDGYPHTTPVWYVYMDGHLYFRVRSKAQKARHLARNPKVCCLVETGQRWRDLKAVMLRGTVEPITDPAVQQRFDEALLRKYEAFREPASNMPDRVQAHYAVGKVWYRVVPQKKPATWDNRKIRLAVP